VLQVVTGDGGDDAAWSITLGAGTIVVAHGHAAPHRHVHPGRGDRGAVGEAS
jgi:hypothetical protein